MIEQAAKRTTVERVAELAMQLGGRHLADYGLARSRHDFTQWQLMACLILRAYLKTTYRGVLELLAVSSKLRAALEMTDKLPHYTALQKFSARSQTLAIAGAMIRAIGRAAGARKFAKTSAAMDATGMETTTASAHFQSPATFAARSCPFPVPVGLRPPPTGNGQRNNQNINSNQCLD